MRRGLENKGGEHPYWQKDTADVEGDLVQPGGRLLFVKGLIGSQMCTPATLYSPNASQITFLEKVLELLNDFTESTLVLGGGLQLDIKL